jgi:catechol 2,3-dioxygenase-like lactoylglutathione lyase family enzyme
MAVLNSSKLIGFVATAKADEARRFYSEALGLPLIDEGPYALVFDANGTKVRVQKVAAVTPAGYTALGWAVEDIDQAIDELTGRGVRFERFEGVSQSESGVWRTPDGSGVAWFRDPDGNILSLTQYSGG